MGAPQYEQAGADIGGTGTTGTIPVWTGPSTLGNSLLSQSGSIVTNTGTFRADNGAVTEPAYTFSASSGTGMYRATSGALLRFAVSGAYAFGVDTSGNVGIGAASPSAKLDIPSTATLAGIRVQVAAAPKLNFYNAEGHYFRNLSDQNRVAIDTVNNYIDASLAAGWGLKLPATPGNADTQTLDCYAEVAWTPADVSGAGLAITVNRATYTKIGRTVTASFDITYPVTANGTAAQISLPESTGTANLGTLSAPYCSVALAAGLTGIVTNGKIVFYYGFPSANVPNSTFSGARIVASVTFTV